MSHMLKIRYSPGEVDISGTPQDLQITRSQLIDFLKSPAKNFALNANAEFNPAPYSKAIPKFEISKTSGTTKISLAADCSVLRVEGSPDNLNRFLSWFDVPLDARSGFHNHFDSFGNPCVDEESLPTVIGVD